jgi:hypothetical protein
LIAQAATRKLSQNDVGLTEQTVDPLLFALKQQLDLTAGDYKISETHCLTIDVPLA